MSETKITVERVNEVERHPNADRLDIVQVLGYKVISGRDQFKVGDSAIYFPPDILLPENICDDLEVTKYLKHSLYPGELIKRQCRVSAARLRGVPSHGFVVGPVENDSSYGTDLTDKYGGVKYEPPVRVGAGEASTEYIGFHQYTTIQNVQRYPWLIPAGTLCRYTEKIHGTNCRLGLVKNPIAEWEFVAGSHKLQRKELNSHGERASLYWEPMTENVMYLLTNLCNETHEIVIFGEIFGQGVQDLDYGQKERMFRVFDISVDGQYMDYIAMMEICKAHSLKTVPLLYVGEFDLDMVEELTYGKTTLTDPDKITSKFKDREGVVVTPLKEVVSRTGMRVIVKSVSADYRDRRGAVDMA